MREEGRGRLGRTRLELASSSLVAGFDVVFGVIALASADAAITPHFGKEAGHLVGALAFGLAFIFITIGRSELSPRTSWSRSPPSSAAPPLVAWIAGALLTLGSFGHVIVVTLEMIFGHRFGAPIPWLDVLRNFGVAAAGNMVGGLAFVTLTRTGQAIGSSEGGDPIEEGPPAAV